MKLTLEFSGGLELLFGHKKRHDVDVSASNNSEELTVRDLLTWIAGNMLKERPEMFLKDGTVRPGVLVLVNDTDWEISGNLDSVVEDGDRVSFISTLHGG